MYWIQFAFSIFWITGVPGQITTFAVLQIFIIAQSIITYIDFQNWDAPEAKSGDEPGIGLWWYLVTFNLLNILFGFLIHIFTVYFPIIGPWLTLAVTFGAQYTIEVLAVNED